jgi:hypothetical protein
MLRVILVILGIVGFGVFSIAMMYLLWVVHQTLDRICVRHARRFCRRLGLEISRVRWQIEFERRSDGRRGVKTECTLVQVDCFDVQKQRRLVLLRVWPLGVRKLLSNEIYPDSYDSQWPKNAPNQSPKPFGPSPIWVNTRKAFQAASVPAFHPY